MENVELTKYEQEFYNDKRFPKRWQAFLASALMRTAGVIIWTVIINVIFDIAVPFELSEKDVEALKTELTALLKQIDQKYSAAIQI